MACTAKHTKYQPTDAEWLCPSCGIDKSGFWIDESAAGCNDGCELLHEADSCCCTACGKYTTGKAFAARLQKAANLVPCSCCKGTGLVPRSFSRETANSSDRKET